MSELQTAIRAEIEDLHVFFVNWFTGKAAVSELDTRFTTAMDPALVFISPDGAVLTAKDLIDGFAAAHGANPDFAIEVRDVTIHREIGDLVLATYTEWQKGARNSARPNNGRITTVLMTRSAPIRWLHLQETWLPEAVQDAASYDF